LVLIDRAEAELIRKELEFNASGDVSIESMQKAGKKYGTQYIVSGSFTEIDKTYRIVITTLTVQTAEIAARYSADIANDKRFQGVSGYKGKTTTAKSAVDEEKKAAAAEQIRENKTSLGLNVSVQGGPVFGTDILAGKMIYLLEARIMSFGIDLGFSDYFGNDVYTVTLDEKLKEGNSLWDGKSNLWKTDHLLLTNVGLNYVIYGPRWDVTLGPGLEFEVETDPGIFNFYLQGRFNLQLLKRGIWGSLVPFLRIGYRVDFTNDTVLKTGLFKNYLGDKPPVLHTIFIGLQFGFDSRGWPEEEVNK